MKDRTTFGVMMAIIIFLICIIAFQQFGHNQLEKRTIALEMDLKICQGHRDTNLSNYQACESKLKECERPKPLEERLKNLTLQDVITHVRELQEMVKEM